MRRGELRIEDLGKRYCFRSAAGANAGAMEGSESDTAESSVDSEEDDAKAAFSLFRPQAAEVWALRNFSCHIEPGERVAIVGCNGSGKTTLIKILAGIVPPSEGSVIGAGRVIPFRALRKLLAPDLTAIENLKFLGRLVGIPQDLLEERLPQIIEFSEVGQVAYEQASRLSAGSFLRLSMAMALFSDADIYLIDDDVKLPDQPYRLKFEKKFAELLRRDLTLIYASNNLEQLRSYCRRAFWIDRGKLMADGNISTILLRFQSEANQRQAGEHQPPPVRADIDLKLVSMILSWVRQRVENSNPKQVWSEISAYINVAREQVKVNRSLTEEEITAVITLKEASGRNLADELYRIEKLLLRLIIGEAMDQHQDTLKAHEHVRSRIAVLAQESEGALNELTDGPDGVEQSQGEGMKSASEDRQNLMVSSGF